MLLCIIIYTITHYVKLTCFSPFLYVILLYYRITSTHNLSVVKSIAEAIGEGYDIPAVKGETIFVLS